MADTPSREARMTDEELVQAAREDRMGIVLPEARRAREAEAELMAERDFAQSVDPDYVDMVALRADLAREKQRADTYESAATKALNERDALAERLRVAREALGKIAERHIPTYPTDYEWMRGIANDHRRIAREALERTKP